MDANKYCFEPFEAAIALMTTRYISEHVSRAELGAIINPRVIKLKPIVLEKTSTLLDKCQAMKTAKSC